MPALIDADEYAHPYFSNKTSPGVQDKSLTVVPVEFFFQLVEHLFQLLL